MNSENHKTLSKELKKIVSKGKGNKGKNKLLELYQNKKLLHRGTWLARLVEHGTLLDLGVVSSSPTLGIEITFNE